MVRLKTDLVEEISFFAVDGPNLVLEFVSLVPLQLLLVLLLLQPVEQRPRVVVFLRSLFRIFGFSNELPFFLKI